MRTLLLFVSVLSASAACALPRAAGDPAPPAADDPAQGEVPLPAADGWNARLLIDNDVGIWTVKPFQVFPQYASPEVVGLDDKGRCIVLVSYSGKWTPLPRVSDGKWLGGLAHADLDPRAAGAELYTGGQLGNLYQLRAYPTGALDSRLIGHFPGREIHTLIPLAGRGLLVFTRPGGLWLMTPDGADGEWRQTSYGELDGRIRDAVPVDIPGTGGPAVAAVTRAGWLRLMRLGEHGPEWQTIWQTEMGLGRLAWDPERPSVLYHTLDDGRVMRHERGAAGAWKHETIYQGPQGPRGLVAGRFSDEPGVDETVAVFGYSGKVQLLSRRGAAWSAETIFQDRDKGHWLAVAELDGRNGTRELLASGYGARIVMLARPPGYGAAEGALPPADEAAQEGAR
ncbi:MAG: hypothetical protein H8E31_03410 [Planctomycetes bacterium]|nr:hypothetical protein [Planctomycetota bacterium]